MKEIVKLFNNNPVRCFIVEGKPYFSASDVCNCLGLDNITRAVKSLKKDGVTTSKVIDTIGRNQEIIIINEPNLYRLIFKSKKEEADKFQEWIFEEVIPSIRKTGKYSIPDSIGKISVQDRNSVTSEWLKHGITKPHEYIQLTLQEYKSLDIKDKKKKDFTRGELLLLSALESMEALKLFNDENINGYYECKESLIETGNIIKKVTDNNLKDRQGVII
jgi:prophage antirepressor-like protein